MARVVLGVVMRWRLCSGGGGAALVKRWLVINGSGGVLYWRKHGGTFVIAMFVLTVGLVSMWWWSWWCW